MLKLAFISKFLFLNFTVMTIATNSNTQTPNPLPKSLQWIDTTSGYLDDQFRIPNTNIRFGLDALIGFVPAVGDFVSFAVSASMIIAIVNHGVSLSVLLRMLWNITLDYLMGFIPFIGDLVDVGFKANRRNVNLLKAYYSSGKHKPSNKYVIWLVALSFLLVLGTLVGIGIYLILRLLFEGASQL